VCKVFFLGGMMVALISVVCGLFMSLIQKSDIKMKSLLTKHAHYLNKGDKLKAEATEEGIIDSIEDAIKEELFFSLPTNEIVKIIQKSNISNAETYSNIISRMCEVKGGEAALLLNVVESKEATFEECVKIVSSLKCSPICVRLGDIYAENEKQPEIDKLKQEIEELKQKKSFKPVTGKPFDFESDIHKAAIEGKLARVQYLIEQSVQAKVEEKNLKGWAPLHSASETGKIEVVKYLIEQCRANVEAKDNDGRTPLYYASGKTKEYLQSFVRS
jgi:hypothetical protein